MAEEREKYEKRSNDCCSKKLQIVKILLEVNNLKLRDIVCL